MQRKSDDKSQFATDLSKLIDDNACLNSSIVSVMCDHCTKEVVQALLPTSSVIHLATHATHATLADSIAEQLQLEETTDAEIEGDYSIKGAIVLSKSPPTCSGILTSSKILTASLIRCELMTLSCCRTGCGKVTGDGILGLSRAVLVAGANCLIPTLWAIEDDSTLSSCIHSTPTTRILEMLQKLSELLCWFY